MSTPVQPPPDSEGRVAGLIRVVQGLTLTNVLVIALLVIVAIPAYSLYRVLNDDELLDRLLSNYRELASPDVNCVLRTAKFRGGNPIWTVSTGFAFRGRDRYVLGVVLDHPPDDGEQKSYCETVKVMADSLYGGGQ